MGIPSLALVTLWHFNHTTFLVTEFAVLYLLHATLGVNLLW